jgi:hypothetical protein
MPYGGAYSSRPLLFCSTPLREGGPNAYKTVVSDVWWCGACKPDGAQGPFPGGGGQVDGPRFCEGCGVFLENPLTEAGVGETRKLVAHPWYECADELRAFYGDVL